MEDTMRLRTGLAVALLMLLPVAGCARGPDGGDGVASATTAKPSASATGSASHDPKNDEEMFLKYAQCMRDHGVPMDDPNIEGGGVNITIPQGTDKSKVDAANQECKQYMPNAGQPQKPDPAAAEQMRKFAQCMRDHGITNFPDPQEDGGLMIDSDKLGIDPMSQPFKDAQNACSQYQPKPPGGGGDGGPMTQEHNENGGGKA
jgi:hypothetical protein